MTTETAANVTKIEEATTARWLAEMLEHARADVTSLPTAEAVDRIRVQVLGVAASRKAEHSIAA